MKDTGGMILNIQRMSTEDGPGLRTTVFFKGCPLSCEWCHNPESLSFKKEIEWFPDRCMGCGTCESICTLNAISFNEEHIMIDHDACSLCMACTGECPANALESKGKYITAADLVAELVKDTAYFGDTGGVTLSGGEALAQPDFSIETARLLNERGIRVAVDTCGLVKPNVFRKIIPYTDLFLFDLKLMDSNRHEKYTGSSNELILDNLVCLAEMIRHSVGKRLWVRTPLIPEATDNLENIAAVRDYINNNISDITDRWELCSFNNLCSAKYRRLGSPWKYEGMKKQPIQILDKIHKTACTDSLIAERTFVTGGSGI